MRWVHRSTAAAIAATLLLTVLAVAPAAAEEQPPRRTITCGETITESIRVANDLTCTSGGPSSMLSIADGVVVDLDGHTLTNGHGSRCYWPPYQGCQIKVGAGATLTNGKVEQVGVFAEGGQITRIHAVGARFLIMSRITRGRLADSRVIDTYVNFFSSAEIHRNRFIRSTAETFDDVWSAVGFSVADNVFRDGGRGIVVSSHVTYFYPDISGEIVRNDIRGAGISVRGSSNLGELTIADNTVVGSPGNGIDASGGARSTPYAGEAGPLTIRGNRTLRNGGHGIVFSGTVAFIDGGGNVARNNALDPQCVGLLCTRS